MLRIEHVMLYSLLFQKFADRFRLFDRYRSHQNRPSRSVDFHDFFGDRLKFRLFIEIDTVLQVPALDLFVGRNNHDIHIIDIAEFFFFRLRSTGHTG